ncbi:MAG: Holliday junction resolvase RuvX [Deltaproteobacteria bacterium]|nr:Holliday junction resolvase RuvX [Deltaproteobacteria bacterium]
MKRLAVDYGKRRAGLAVTDNEGKIIMPYKVIVYKNSESFIKQIIEEIKKLLPSEIVFGLPLNMDGSESEMSGEVRRLAKKIEREMKIKIVFYDERLTTFEAKEMLTMQGISAKRQKEIIDMYAAYCILKSYISEKEETKDD